MTRILQGAQVQISQAHTRDNWTDTPGSAQRRSDDADQTSKVCTRRLLWSTCLAIYWLDWVEPVEGRTALTVMNMRRQSVRAQGSGNRMSDRAVC